VQFVRIAGLLEAAIIDTSDVIPLPPAGLQSRSVSPGETKSGSMTE
jgi:hypothetical protein